jgi:hypothetical protein
MTSLTRSRVGASSTESNLSASPRERPTVPFDGAALARYVLGRRTPDGGYSYYRTREWRIEEPNALDTLAALESLRLLGISVPDPGDTIRWLQSLQEADGSFSSLTIGWAAVRALALLGSLPRRSSSSWRRRQVAERVRRQSGVTDWRAAVSDVAHLFELRRVTKDDAAPDESPMCVATLVAARDTDGGWAVPGSDLETTAVAARLAMVEGLNVDERSLPDFFRRCEDRELGFCVSPRGRTTSAAALWGGMSVSRQFGLLPRYGTAVEQNLVLLQRPDGGLGSRHLAISTLQETWRGLAAARLLEQTREEQL